MNSETVSAIASIEEAFQAFLADYDVSPEDVQVDVALTNGDTATFFGLRIEPAGGDPAAVRIRRATTQMADMLLVKVQHIFSVEFKMASPPPGPFGFIATPND